MQLALYRYINSILYSQIHFRYLQPPWHVSANLHLVLVAVEEEEWEEVSLVVMVY